MGQGGDNTYVCVMDINKAFDHVTISMVIRAMQYLKYPLDLIIAVVEPMIWNSATFDFQDISSNEILCNKSVRTGGKEGPVLFNIVLEAIWGSIIHTWEARGFGVKLDGDGAQQALVNHFLWAGNVALVAVSATQLRQMVGMMTVTLRRAGMDWKQDSLEYLIFGLRPNQGPQSLVCDVSDMICQMAGDPSLPDSMRQTVVLPRKSDCEILGVKLVADPQDVHAVKLSN